MSSDAMRRLMAVLEEGKDSLWQLQNVALRLTVEGPSPEASQLLADGLNGLAAQLGDAGPTAVRDALVAASHALRAKDVEPALLSRTFQLVEALVSLQSGEGEAALLRIIGAEQEPRPAATQADVPPSEDLSDRPEDIDAEDLRLFAAEAREHIERIEASLVQLEATRDVKLIAEIFRGAHSIKGAAQYLGLEATATLAHRAETLLDRLRSNRLALGPEVVSLLLRSFDTLGALIDTLVRGDGPRPRVRGLVGELDALIAREESHAQGASDEAPVTGQRSETEVVSVRPAPGEAPTAGRDIGRHWDRGQDDSELFAVEYRENIASARALLANLRSLLAVPDQVAVASRNLHSLKGLAGLVGIVEMERIAGALDALVGRVVRRGEVAVDLQPTVDLALDLLEDVFARHRRGDAPAANVEDIVAQIEALTAREGRSASSAPADPWNGIVPDPVAGPLAERLAETVAGLRRGEEGVALKALAELAREARVQGCDEAGAAAAALRKEWSGLQAAVRRERLLGLRALLPSELLSWRAQAPSPTGTSFQDIALTVPGIGPKKLRRLAERGIDSLDAVQALGLQGLIATPGINIEQAKMLVAKCATAPASPDAQAATDGRPAIERQVLDDDYDRQLVAIYLDTTLRQIDAARSRLGEGELTAAAELIGDLAAAARYMGYGALVDAFAESGRCIEGEPTDSSRCEGLLARTRVGIERLRSQVARLQEGATEAPNDTELKELERIFSESAEAHLRHVGRDLRLFFARPDEALLAALQHHLSCIHSAATNIGREAVAVEAEGLQGRIEDLWLNPHAIGPDRAKEAVERLRRVFEGCGVAMPEMDAVVAAVDQVVAAAEPERERTAERPAERVSVDERAAAPSAVETAPEAEGPASGSVAAIDLGVVDDGAAHDTAPAAVSGSTQGEAAGPDAAEGARALVDAQATVRVDTAKIDDLLNMVAELVVNRSAFMVLGANLNELANRLIDSGQLGSTEARDLRTIMSRYDEAMTEQGRVSNQLQQGVMLIRMMPVHTLFSRVPRLVRDLAMRENRRVKVVFSGEDTELDKTVIERLSDPLVHLIRNSISHGIESAEERLAAGKAAEGRLLISARHQGNIVIIEVEDDGRGVDFDKIRRRWVESGLGSALEVGRLSNRELLSALFLPGFSTADRVTDVSGRGVGLDIVKRNIENLGGQVEAVTEPGRLSRFTIRIPLTMAIMQALLVRVASEIYAIPGSAVIEAERIARDRIHSVENQKVITLRNSVIPLVDLDEVFAYNYYLETGQTFAPVGESGSHGQQGADDDVHVVVLQGEGREIGIIVNGLIGSQDIVIKSLEDDLVDGQGIAGASILGDGTVALILDVGELCKIVVDGQHSEELRRAETIRRFERYLQERQRRTDEHPMSEGYVH
jgi:chemotaxis protein histidine kinase CheA